MAGSDDSAESVMPGADLAADLKRDATEQIANDVPSTGTSELNAAVELAVPSTGSSESHTEAEKFRKAEEAEKAKKAEEAEKAKAADEARKVKEAEDAMKKKEAEEARKKKEAQEAEGARKAEEAEKARKAKEAEEAQEARKAVEAEEARKKKEAVHSADTLDVDNGLWKEAPCGIEAEPEAEVASEMESPRTCEAQQRQKTAPPALLIPSQKTEAAQYGEKSPRAIYDKLNEEFSDWPTVLSVSKALKMPPAMVVIGSVLATVGFCFFGFGGQLVCMLLGCTYPAYESFKAIEAFANMAEPTEIYDKASTMQFWLIYWIVVATLSCGEYFFHYGLIWIPFYYPLKLIFQVWLFFPATRGANHVYHWCVSPLLRRNREHIDLALEESGKKLQESGRSVQRTVSGVVMKAAASAVNSGLGSDCRSRTASARSRSDDE